MYLPFKHWNKSSLDPLVIFCSQEKNWTLGYTFFLPWLQSGFTSFAIFSEKNVNKLLNIGPLREESLFKSSSNKFLEWNESCKLYIFYFLLKHTISGWKRENREFVEFPSFLNFEDMRSKKSDFTWFFHQNWSQN